MESIDPALTEASAHPKYLFGKALRPFSFSVALVTCSLGIAAGHTRQIVDNTSALLVLLAGLLLQAGVNLINDHADTKNPALQNQLTHLDKRHIAFNYRFGWICFALCSCIGLYLTYQAGIFLLLLAVTGGFGALFYTTEPINYKRRGLGVILVFFFMGVLMVYGSFFAVTGRHQLEVLYLSIPISFLTSALLLSNELRDYIADKQDGIKTLTVRIGFNKGKALYLMLISLAFITIIPLVITAPLFSSPFFYSLLALLPAALQSIDALITVYGDNNKLNLPPKTGKLYLLFGIGEITVLFLQQPI